MFKISIEEVPRKTAADKYPSGVTVYEQTVEKIDIPKIVSVVNNIQE